ncbi:MAG TPA: MBL fold metallo-hydrolase [Methylomirabilota bacterium]|nr:MBL fold metallo-hydrolase [Methylomirabilota bacterium]
MVDGCSGDDALFEIQTVADGVHVAVAARVYKVNCNTALIETDDGVLVVDSHSKPSAARAIVERIRERTSKPVRYVVNTHFHWDHWQGNEAYPAAYGHVEVITNDITREAMLRKGLKRIQDHVRQGPDEVAQLRAQLATATSPDQRAELGAALRQAEQYLAEVRALRPALPTLAFERAMRMFRGDREIHLLHLGRAHTEGDVFVYLPKERVVVTGDAVIGWTPYMGDGYPQDWPATLRRLEQLDFDRMIMGHGQVAGREWLRTFRSYVEDLVEAVRQEVWAGATLEATQERVRDRLAPVYEPALSREGGTYRPWRTLVLANIERAYQMLS